ncbi:MAG: glycosyltransferase family 4 protein [Planctomycetes bacterium]|nr:glycosyltransferase family 4 protein [Planctomycetota bacterium]
MTIKLGFCATHPIQYQIPIFRALAEEADIELKVYFCSDHSVKGEIDPQFGVPVAWDVPLLSGYDYKFLKNKGTGYNKGGFFAFSNSDIFQEMASERFDAFIVPAYHKMIYWQAMRGAWRLDIPVFMRAEHYDGANFSRPLWKRVFRKSFLGWLYSRMAGLLSVGKYAQRHYVGHGVLEEKIFNTPYCVDNALFIKQRDQFEPQRGEIRKELGISDEATVMLFAGKLVPVKNPMLLAKAVELLKHREHLFLLVMGDGSLRGEFEKKMQELMPESSMIAGFVNQSQVGKYYTAADFLVLPSYEGETWGLVVNEGMLFGLPAIVSDTVGCSEDLIKPGKTGFVFANDDAEDLAGYIDTFLEQPELAKTMGKEARQLISDYSVEVNVQGILKALRSVI